MFESLIRLFKVLNSNQKPSQISLSLVFGMILGLTPLLMPLNLILVLFIFILRINLTALLLALGLFSGLSYLSDPYAHQLGLAILHMPELQPLFTQWYNLAAWRLIEFNHTLVMGSVALAYSLSLPMFILFWWLVKTYRVHFLARIRQFKIVRALKIGEGAENFGLIK